MVRLGQQGGDLILGCPLPSSGETDIPWGVSKNWESLGLQGVISRDKVLETRASLLSACQQGTLEDPEFSPPGFLTYPLSKVQTAHLEHWLPPLTLKGHW